MHFKLISWLLVGYDICWVLFDKLLTFLSIAYFCKTYVSHAWRYYEPVGNWDGVNVNEFQASYVLLGGNKKFIYPFSSSLLFA